MKWSAEFEVRFERGNESWGVGKLRRLGVGNARWAGWQWDLCEESAAIVGEGLLERREGIRACGDRLGFGCMCDCTKFWVKATGFCLICEKGLLFCLCCSCIVHWKHG